MLNLAKLLFLSAKNCKPLILGDRKGNKSESLDKDDYMFDDDQEDMYFQAANWLRNALSEQPRNGEANYLMGLMF